MTEVPVFEWHTWNKATEAYELDEVRTAALVSYRVTFGRPDAYSKVPPNAGTVRLAADLCPVVPTDGTRFQILADGDPRFTGEVTDSTSRPSIDGKQRGTHDLTVVGRWGRASRKTIRARDWPYEVDGERVNRILAQTLLADELYWLLETPVLLVPPANDSDLTAGALVDLVTDSTGGLLVERADGGIEWQTLEWRRGFSGPRRDFSASLFLSDAVWNRRVSDTVNDATVTLANGRSVRVVDRASVRARDYYPTQVSTALRDTGQATSRAVQIVGRRARPGLQLSTLTADLLRSAGTDYYALSNLQNIKFGTRVLVRDLPPRPDETASTELDGFVEQITEEASRLPGSHDVPERLVWRRTYLISPFELSGVSLRWRDVPDGTYAEYGIPGTTWADVKPSLTWLGTTGLELATDLEA